MKRTFIEALEHRRSYYDINSDSPIQDEEVIHIIREAVKYTPSSYNSQSTRIVLLLGEENQKLWDIVKRTLKARTSESSYAHAEAKINGSLACGHGTILFFEDLAIVHQLQADHPTYKENFPLWAQQGSAMHQYAIWTMLEDAGLGVSLQHYNPIIDAEVIRTWQLPESWMLIAQMPFGTPTGEPHAKEVDDVSNRIRIFR
ncbi:MAG: nitroreductase family protein [Prevotellaceae bacterium]|jgi:predicted oxidoreductase (fatty acid repression mutant protein)|nr:nitroreductase family protein [Prevotellaceae bacterium]